MQEQQEITPKHMLLKKTINHSNNIPQQKLIQKYYISVVVFEQVAQFKSCKFLWSLFAQFLQNIKNPLLVSKQVIKHKLIPVFVSQQLMHKKTNS